MHSKRTGVLDSALTCWFIYCRSFVAWRHTTGRWSAAIDSRCSCKHWECTDRPERTIGTSDIDFEIRAEKFCSRVLLYSIQGAKLVKLNFKRRYF